MKYFLAIAFIVLPTIVAASYPVSSWEPEWDMHVRDGSCWLSRGYSDNSELVIPDAKPGDFTIFDRLDLHFIMPVEWERPPSPGYEIGKLYLFLYTNTEPKLSEQQHRIEFARVNGHAFTRIERPNTIHEKYQRNFSLGNTEAVEVFKALLDHGEVTLDLLLSNGESVSLSVPSRASQHFPAWARMLSACAEAETI